MRSVAQQDRISRSSHLADNRDPLLSPVAIKSLRPTQITVGLIEVEQRRQRWDKLGE
ncbi:MAG TPA: ParB-like protein, partial [Sphingomicrobium sp.]|nr:ParB-like protein [Sphingomicrobium sp.]